MRAVFREKKQEADDIYTFYFEPASPIDFVAGQFIELTIEHEGVDNRGANRWFTISNAPFEKYIAITTRRNNPSSTFKQTLFQMQPGTEVTISEPMGDFVLPKDNAIPLIFVGVGIGITPFHSIFAWAADSHEYRDIKFIYAVDNEDEIIFQDTFDRAKTHTTIVVKNPSDEWGGERGRITADHVLKITEPEKGAYIYVSGPEPFVEAIQKDLEKLGVPKYQIITDFFHNYKTY